MHRAGSQILGTGTGTSPGSGHAPQGALGTPFVAASIRPLGRTSVDASPPKNSEKSFVLARAQQGRLRTVTMVPKHQPPRTTHAGHLHAAGSIPSCPVGSIPVEADTTTPTRPSPLRSLVRPVRATSGDLIVTRKLDGGRLRCEDLIEHAGWDLGIVLEADVSTPGRLHLRPAQSQTDKPIAHTRTAHVLEDKRMLIPGGLRDFLGVNANAIVLVVSGGDGIITIAPTSLVRQGIAAIDTLGELVAHNKTNITHLTKVASA